MGKALSKQWHKKLQEEYGMPALCYETEYFEGYDKPLCLPESSFSIFPHHNLFKWVNKDTLYLCPEYPTDLSHPVLIAIPKENILSFTMIGDIQTYLKTTGGGVSVGGAIVGAALMGGHGAILGGRNKTQTETVTNDKRKTVLVFREDEKQKTVFFGPELFDFLCEFCIEKKDAPINPQPEQTTPDIPEQIKKLAELHEQGILTDDEFSGKKAELLARI